MTKSSIRSLCATDSKTMSATKEDLLIKQLYKTFISDKSRIKEYLQECLGFTYYSKRMKKTLLRFQDRLLTINKPQA